MSETARADASAAALAGSENALDGVISEPERICPDAGAGSSRGLLDRPLRVTFFQNRAATRKTGRTLSLRALADVIRTTTAPRKTALPLLKLARFGDRRTEKRSLRHDANVLAVDGIEADYDGERVPPDEARELLKAHGLAALIYTSPSHTPEAPRWRVLCPLAAPREPGERAGFVARLQGALGGVLERESFTLSQAYYFGAIGGGSAPRVELIDGRPIDLAGDMDARAVGRRGEGPAGGTNPEDPFTGGAGTSRLGLEADPGLVASALSAVPNDAPPEWNQYNTMLMAVWAATGGSDEGRAAALAWSGKNPHHDPQTFDERWEHYGASPPTRIGAGTIFHLAKQHGWRDPRAASLPPLRVHPEDLPKTAADLAAVLAARDGLFDRGVPVRLAHDAQRRGLAATPLTVPGVVREAHGACEPFVLIRTRDGEASRRVTLPDRVAALYLDMRGLWGLPPLDGIAASPLLDDEGAIRSGDGYDAASGLYRERVPEVAVPDRPSRGDAERALARLRARFRTFPFADARTRRCAASGTAIVDGREAPGQDESAALTALLTGVARASLDLAPGVLIRAPALSGAGTGKGLLARCICAVAFGRAPSAMTAGHDRQELEKRIAAALLEADPAVLLDNLNGMALRSDTLASALTERPARMRVLGRSATATLNSAALILATGNGLSVSEDLARRFMAVNLDARTEDPEARDFRGDLLAEVQRDRGPLLADALTIWRWGRREGEAVPRGRPLGSFGRWARWCRDPLVALGCRDVAERVAEAKADDPRRRAVAAALAHWWRAHRDRPVRVADLAAPVVRALDPQERGRQFLASRVAVLGGTQIAGFNVTRSDSATRWGVATYALRAADPEAADGGLRHTRSAPRIRRPPTGLRHFRRAARLSTTLSRPPRGAEGRPDDSYGPYALCHPLCVDRQV